MTEYTQVMDIFKQIADTPGKNDKQSIVAANGDNTLFTGMLNFLYSDFVRTGLALAKIRKEVAVEPNVQLTNIKDAMVHVATYNTGSDQIIANIQAYINQCPAEDKLFLEELFTKTYKCGITVSTVNKALGKGFVPEFGCQLAHPYEKHEKKIKDTFFLTQKLDGHRTLAFIDSLGNVTFTTRKGHEIDLLVDVEAAVKHFVEEQGLLNRAEYNKGFVLDGEAVLTDQTGLKIDEVFRATAKALKKKGIKTNLTLHVFDLIPLDQFKDGESLDIYDKRRSIMESMFLNLDSPELVLVKVLYRGSDKDQIIPLQEYASNQGWEGLMLNTASGLYKTKRTADLLKIKSFYNSDVLVIDTYEGKEGTENEGSLGGVVVEFKDFNVNVGSGFTQEERALYHSKPELILGKIINVQYFEETKNQKGVKNLRFATYKGVRDDKTVDDISYES